MTNKISLKMDESNELKFQLRINGETSEPEATKPQVRFLLVEKNNSQSMGLVFPVSRSDDNLIVFSLPSLTGIVKVGTTYQGKVEVILGTRIFCPQTIDISFTRELSVEVTQVKEPEQPVMEITDILTEIERPTAVSSMTNVRREPGKKQVTLTKTQLESLLKRNRQPVPAPTKTKTPTSSTKGMKENLKDLMRSALKDDEDDDQK